MLRNNFLSKLFSTHYAFSHHLLYLIKKVKSSSEVIIPKHTHTYTKYFIMASSNNCFLLQNYILSYFKFPLWRFNWSPLLFLTTFIMPARYTIIIDNSHYIPTSIHIYFMIWETKIENSVMKNQFFNNWTSSLKSI